MAKCMLSHAYAAAAEALQPNSQHGTAGSNIEVAAVRHVGAQQLACIQRDGYQPEARLVGEYRSFP